MGSYLQELKMRKTIKAASAFALTALLLLLFPLAASSQSLEAADFFAIDEITNVSISPDGAHIFRVHQKEFSSELNIMNLGTEEVVENWRYRGGANSSQFSNVVWANEGRIIYSIRQPLLTARDSTRLSLVWWAKNLDGSNTYQLTDTWNDHNIYRLENILPEDPENILVIGHSRRYRKSGGRGDSLRIEQGSSPIAYLMNVNRRAAIVLSRPTGRGAGLNLKEIEKSPLEGGMLHVDNSGNVRIAISRKGGRTSVLVKKESNSAWENVTSDFEGIDGNRLQFVRFSGNNKSFYLLKYSKHRTIGLFEYFMQDGRLVEIYSHPEFDLKNSDLVFSFMGNEVIGVRFWGDLHEAVYFSDNPDVQVNRWLDELFATNLVRIDSVSNDGKKAVLFIEGPREPGTYYLLEVEELNLKQVGSVNSELVMENLAEAEPFLVESNGSVRIHGIYTESVESRPGQPTVIVINGERDTLKYDRLSQYLAQTGYSTIHVDIRGTDGLVYENRPNEVTDSMIAADVNAVLNWAKQEGLTSDGKVCLWGQSEYGLILLHQMEYLGSGVDCVVADSMVFGPEANEILADIQANLASIKVPVFLSTGGDEPEIPVRQIRRIRNGLIDNGTKVVWFRERYRLAEIRRGELVEEAKTFLDSHIGFEN
ncbi:MAG: hypothetical protein R3F41_14715 [Gammaproteobacteria bacterium]|nr:hypothetical protein [Pseudomonadales bacterium]MCP5347230.1 hypothetical protein [Pseudomonadales bacterium]